MAYNPVSTGEILMSKTYAYKVEKLSGGCTSNENICGDGFVANMTDMYSDGARLRTRGAFSQVCEAVEGELKTVFHEEYYGSIIFHAGNSLYRFDGEKTHLLSENVGEKGFFLRMNAKVYYYSDAEKVYEIDKEFNCTEAKPYVPNIIKDANKYLEEYTADEPFNMLTRRIKCSYALTSTSNTEDYCAISIPYPPDLDEPVKVYIDGKSISIQRVSYDEEEKKLAITLKKRVLWQTVAIEYAVARDTEVISEYLKKIYGSRLAFSYGGTTKDGTRGFITGNPDFPSMYFRSELKNPLCFFDNAQETLGDGSENVNGAEKRYEKMYFFTDKHIYSMTYSFSEENGAVFTVTPVNTGVGCSMFGTVRALDNTIVFADKTEGVHILQSTDIFDELNIMPISENIKGDTALPFGKDGKYFSCDFDRKYYICNGNAVYMWDYGRVPFFSGTEYRTSQEKLPWSRICDADELCDVFYLSGKLYFFSGKTNCAILEYSDDVYCDTVLNEDLVAEQRDISSSFTTKKYDFNNAYMQKRLMSFSFDYENKSGKERKIYLSFFGDGKLFSTANVTVREAEGRITVRVPCYYAGKYSVKFMLDGGGIGIDKLAFIWRKSERVKFYNQ